MDEKDFYGRIRKLAKASDKSLNQIEKELGYSRNALNNYKGKTMPSAIRLLELADYFDVTPRYLIGLDEICSKEKREDRLVEFIFKNLNMEQKQKMWELCEKCIKEEIVIDI